MAIIEPPQSILFNSGLNWVVAITMSNSVLDGLYTKSNHMVWGVVYQVIIEPPKLTLFNSVLDWVVAIRMILTFLIILYCTLQGV